MRKRPFLFVGMASFLSAWICSLISYHIGVVIVAVAALFLLAASFVKRVPLSPRLAAVIGLGALVVCVGFAARMTNEVEPRLTLDGTVATVTVRVEEGLSTSGAYIVRVEDGELPRGMRLCFWTGYRAFAVKCGDLLSSRVELIAAYEQERENGNTAKANGVYVYAWPAKGASVRWMDGQASLPLFERLLYQLREGIHTILYRRMSYDGAAMSEGMMLGNCDNISDTAMRAFRTSGVYHLLAVSGGHLSIIMAAILKVGEMLGVPRRLRAVLTMAAIVLFMALCGFVDSINRAGVSALLILCGQLVFRRADGLNSLGLAAGILLWIDPFCIYDLGWQLSFAATAGLLCMMPLWETEIDRRVGAAFPRIAKVVVPLSTAIGVTVSASVFTLPLTMAYSGEISTVSLLGNMVCVPLSTALLCLNFLSVLTAWCAPLSLGLFAAAEWISDSLFVFTRWLASLPFAAVTATNPLLWAWLAVTVGAIVLGYRLCRMRGVCRAAVVMTAVLVIGCLGFSVTHRDVVHITVAPSDKTAVCVRTRGTCGLIVSAHGEALKEAALLADKAHVKRVDWLLWLGEPCKQAADLSAFDIAVDRLMLTGLPESFAALPKANVTTVFSDGDVLHFGDNGALESCAGFWRVSIGETTCLIAAKSGVNAAKLSEEWCRNSLCLLEVLPFSFERLQASQTVLIAKHNTSEEWQTKLIDAMAAVKGDTLHFSTRGDGNITLRE